MTLEEQVRLERFGKWKAAQRETRAGVREFHLAPISPAQGRANLRALLEKNND